VIGTGGTPACFLVTKLCISKRVPHDTYAELLPGFLEETTSYVFKHVYALSYVLFPEVIE
jgi:hypothetical protein